LNKYDVDMDIGRLVLIDLYSVLEIDNFHRKWSV